MIILGVDLGTSALKAVLTDSAETVIAQASVPLATAHPRPGWSEQDPRDWWRAFCDAASELRATHGQEFRAIRALGLSGQMHGAVLLDRSGTPIRPAILWNDGRAVAECAALEAAFPDLAAIAGVPAMPGFTAPKLLWLKRHEPQSVARLWKVVSPKDYLRHRLTGEAVTDMADAAGTLWLDQAARGWSEPLLSASGMRRSQMPRLVEGSAASGALLPARLSELGIDGSVIVAGGGGDAAAAAVGIGAVNDGDAFISLGTSAQLFVADERYRPQPGTMLHAFAHALPDRWFRMAAMLNGASCLAWLAGIVGEDVGALIDRAEAAERGPSPVLFLPYLSGERTPHNDPDARGVFAGLDPTTGAAELTLSVLDGVAFSLAEARLLLERADTRLSDVAAVGGGARSRFWMRRIADILRLPVIRYQGGDTGPAFGAARLAQIALTGESAPRICGKPAVLDVSEPDPARSEAYQPHFEAWRRLYRALRPAFGSGVRPLP